MRAAKRTIICQLLDVGLCCHSFSIFFFASSAKEFKVTDLDTKSCQPNARNIKTRWWFQAFFTFTLTLGDDPVWQAYFCAWVEITNWKRPWSLWGATSGARHVWRLHANARRALLGVFGEWNRQWKGEYKNKWLLTFYFGFIQIHAGELSSFTLDSNWF